MGHRHVVLRAQLEVTLDAARGMVGSLTLVAVGQEHDDTGVLLPLLLGGGDELVDDGLRTLCEVTELSLPRHEGVLAFDG